MTWRITDAESGESIDVVSMGQGADPGDKGVPKALTNNLKYAILLVLQAAGDDPEADASVDENTGARPARAGRGRGTAVTTPTDDSPVASLAPTALKSKIRAKAREVGLDDEKLKLFAQGITKKDSSTEWTVRDAEKVQSRLERPDLVETFLDDLDIDAAIATVKGA